MKILLAPVGTDGDIRPIAALGIRLRSAGHEICAGAPPNCRELFERMNIPFRPVGRDFRAEMETISDTIMGHPVAGLRTMMRFCNDAIREQGRDLYDCALGCNFIIGGGLQFAGASVAQALKTGYRHVVHIPQFLPSDAHPPIMIPWHTLPRPVNRAIWHVTNGMLNLVLKKSVNAMRTGMGLAPVPDILSIYSAGIAVAMDPELAPVPPDARLPYIQTGYPLLDDHHELDSALKEFICTGKPPVYIGFGSMTDRHPKHTMKIIVKTVENAGIRAVVSRGWADLPDPGHSDIMLVDTANHGALFPLMSAIVHHGGAGTTYAAARAGVPQVIVPHVLDQFYWGKRIHRLGLGPLPVNRSGLSASTLGKAIRFAVTDDGCQKQAKMMMIKLGRHDALKDALRIINTDE